MGTSLHLLVPPMAVDPQLISGFIYLLALVFGGAVYAVKSILPRKPVAA